MYTDTHCHLLPGVDDGVEDWEESLRCLQIAREEKIDTICVTPHIWRERFPNKPDDLKKLFDEWSSRASALGISLHLGSEVFYRRDLAEAWKRGEFISLDGKGAYLLVELPPAFYPSEFPLACYDLRLAGVEPVLAHPERYTFPRKTPGRLDELSRAEIPFQITTHSVVGSFGRAVQKASFYLLERGWVRLMASDAHSSEGRVPLMREAVRIIARRYGKEAARRLSIENPRRLIKGMPLLAVDCVPVKARRRRRAAEI